MLLFPFDIAISCAPTCMRPPIRKKIKHCCQKTVTMLMESRITCNVSKTWNALAGSTCARSCATAGRRNVSRNEGALLAILALGLARTSPAGTKASARAAPRSTRPADFTATFIASASSPSWVRPCKRNEPGLYVEIHEPKDLYADPARC